MRTGIWTPDLRATTSPKPRPNKFNRALCSAAYIAALAAIAIALSSCRFTFQPIDGGDNQDGSVAVGADSGGPGMDGGTATGMDSGTDPVLGLAFEAEDGIMAPGDMAAGTEASFKVAGGLVFQDINTSDPAHGARALYEFSVAQPGSYMVKAWVDAASGDANSFHVNIDAEPTGTGMIWDIVEFTSGVAERAVSWRGAGGFDTPEHPVKTFELTAGTHYLYIRGREAGTQLDRLGIVLVNGHDPGPGSDAGPGPTPDAGPGAGPDAGPPPVGNAIPTDENLKVAFIGDTGIGAPFRAVLELIVAENADVVLHQGDFGYEGEGNREAFFTDMEAVLGPTFPYFVSIGNHDVGEWSGAGGYAERFLERLRRHNLSPDDPNLDDEMYSLKYRGLSMAFVGQSRGSTNAFAQFLEDTFTNDEHIVKICSWHRNQAAMQIGGKPDEMGWDVYENCRRAGAIIATAHEHNYSRTRTLTNMRTQTVDSSCGAAGLLCVDSGRTFAFVSGMGGKGPRSQQRCLPTTFPYGCNDTWASIYAAQQGAQHGALFITFNVDGDARLARGYFKDVGGNIPDTFDVRF